VKRIRALCACFCVCVLALCAPAGAVAEEASGVVERLHDALLQAMQSDESSVTTRAEKLRPVIHDTFDYATIARIVLGRTWGQISESERAQFIDAFTELSVATYAARFKSFNGERFVTLGSEAGRRPDEQLVRTQIERQPSGKPPVSLQYLLKSDADERWRVVNVVADGVSDLSLKRTEYAAELKTGDLRSLVGKLEQKTADLYNGKSAE
jgi:phospholipid transport system substrate-binding protein